MNTIGFDIGGTKISAIAWNGKKITAELKLLTPKNLSELKTTLKEMAEFLAQGATHAKIGVGVAGSVNREKGKVNYSPNLQYINGFNFKKFFLALGFSEVKVENDANCFVLAESKLGLGRGLKNFCGLTLGTGLGGGLISQEKLYVGVHGSAGEPGWMLADEKFTFEQKFQIFKAKENWKDLGALIGRLAANIQNLLDVEAIILGGSVARKFAKQITSQALAEANKHIMDRRIKPKILVSKLKHAGAIGAALLFK